MLGRIADIIAYRLGFEIRRRPSQSTDWFQNSTDPLDKDIDNAISIVENYTMLSTARLDTLYRQVVHCERAGIKGGLVECGVWKGGAVALMALANMRHGQERRHLHLFDSFTDICEPDAEVDGERAIREVLESGCPAAGTSGQLRPMEGMYDQLGGPGSMEEVRSLLVETVGYDPDFVHLHKGWFQDTVPQQSSSLGDIALLRLDGDWYASVRICLDHLYSNVTPGGFVIIDDYRYYEGCTRAVDEFREAHRIGAFLHHADYTNRAHAYWIK